MIDLRKARTAVGRALDAASATGSLQAKLAQMLAHMSTTVAGRIDASLSSRMRSIVSIQRGVITGTTATVSSFDTTKYLLNYLGGRRTDGSAPVGAYYNMEHLLYVTNATTLTFSPGPGASGASVADAGYELVEFD